MGVAQEAGAGEDAFYAASGGIAELGFGACVAISGRFIAISAGYAVCAAAHLLAVSWHRQILCQSDHALTSEANRAWSAGMEFAGQN
jgi:hypothetical protein